MTYARDGHGGNAELERRGEGAYQVSVLEAFHPSARDDILAAEIEWKLKLGSRRFG